MSRPPTQGRDNTNSVRQLSIRLRVRAGLTLAFISCVTHLAAPTSADGQRRDTTTRARPPAGARVPALVPACCKVVALDSANRMVTARETATGYAFRFRVYDVRDFTRLEIGDPVWADFANRTVRVDAGEPEPCCTILSAPAPADPPRKAPPPLPDGSLRDTPPLGRPFPGA